MKNILIYIYIVCCIIVSGLITTSCQTTDYAQIKPIQVQLFALYDSDKINIQDPCIRRIFYDPYVLNINMTNSFSMSHKDIAGIEIMTNDNRYFVNFHLKKKLSSKFFQFTTSNTNSYVAVMVDGKVKTIARIDKPVQDGNFQLVAKLSQTLQLRKFLQLFIL